MEKIWKIGIVFDETKTEARKSAEATKKWLEDKKCQVFIEDERKLVSNNLDKLDFIITFGGDGFILRWANEMIQERFCMIPLLRVNFGRQGVLANIEPEEDYIKLRRVMNDNYIITERTRIQAEIGKGENHKFFNALNDIIIERTQARIISFEIIIIDRKGNEEKFEARGDGIIFSTRTGSTAYAESAGGPTLLKENKFILRMISPTDREGLSYKITPTHFIFKITKIKGKARLVIDGEEVISELKQNDLVKISKSPISTYFMEIGDVEK
jgi:NAD+ kinase